MVVLSTENIIIILCFGLGNFDLRKFSFLISLSPIMVPGNIPYRIRIYHECEGRLEKSVPRIAF